MNELHTCNKAVMNCPGIVFHDKVHPENVMKTFPGAIKERTSNGSISFKISEHHIKKGMEGPLSQLIGFRQYIHYHVDAIKI